MNLSPGLWNCVWTWNGLAPRLRGLLRDPKYGLDYEPWRRSHDVPNAYGFEGGFNQGHLHPSDEGGSETQDSMEAAG